MAKIDDILRLQEAGFSADDITKLLPLVKDEEVKVEYKPPVTENKQEKTVTIDELNTKLDELVKRVEANALLNTQQEENKPRTIDDVLADIIEPSK